MRDTQDISFEMLQRFDLQSNGLNLIIASQIFHVVVVVYSGSVGAGVARVQVINSCLINCSIIIIAKRLNTFDCK